MDFVNSKLKDRYRIEAKIGGGGMGSIYRAVDELSGKVLAVKRLHLDHSDNEVMNARFLREAEVPKHENIVAVLDKGEHQGALFIVMEYLEGEDLQAFMRREGPLDLHTSLVILDAVLSALEAAHEKNIIHRDLTPKNIFLSRGPNGEREVKVIDFGIAKFVGGTVYTETSDILGTLNYMSPEQCNSAAVLDHRTDIWAVGVILYEMLTGKCPFAAGSNITMVYNIIACAPPPLRQADPNAPAEAEPLIQWLLKKEPDERPSSAREVLDSVRQLLKSTDPPVRVSGPFRPASIAREAFGISPADTNDTPKPFSMYTEVTRPDLSRPFTVSETDLVVPKPKREKLHMDLPVSLEHVSSEQVTPPRTEASLPADADSLKRLGISLLVVTTAIALIALAAIITLK